MKAILVVALALTFIGGYLVSRARYKPQILELNKMVIEKDSTINRMRANANKIMMRDDVMWVVENGIVSEMKEAVTLTNGDTVSIDGIVKSEDGSETKLQNGESMGMDGQIIPQDDAIENGF